jgi:HlyD family secretion protein
VGTTPPGPAGSANGNPACNRIPTDQQAVVNGRRQVMTDKTALDATHQKLNVDRASGQVSIENARQSVIAAQNNLDAVRSDRPFDIEQQVALVASAQAQVAAAQRDVDNTVLRAPVAGTVSVINGVPGEYIGPSQNTTPLAPGSFAPIPGVAGGGANSSVSLGNSDNGPQRPGGNQFLVLSEINTFQVVVPFEESDAAKVAAGSYPGRDGGRRCSHWQQHLQRDQLLRHSRAERDRSATQGWSNRSNTGGDQPGRGRSHRS